MPPPLHRRDTLTLLAVALRRGETSVSALAALARGEQIDADEFERLKRAGLLQRERLPPRLLVPVLALEASLGLAGAELLEQLLGLLKGANDRPARDALLAALRDQLVDEIAAFAGDEPGPLEAERLHRALDDLALTVSRMRADDAEPALVTQVAQLAARLVEALAAQVALPRRVRRRAPLPEFTPDLLALAVADLTVMLPRPLLLPDAHALARSLAGDSPLPQGAPTRPLELAESGRTKRREAVAAALRSVDPVGVLYAGQDLAEALRRHAQLVGFGRDALVDAQIVPTADRLAGPAPLAWSTALNVEVGTRTGAAAAADEAVVRESEAA